MKLQSSEFLLFMYLKLYLYIGLHEEPRPFAIQGEANLQPLGTLGWLDSPI